MKHPKLLFLIAGQYGCFVAASAGHELDAAINTAVENLKKIIETDAGNLIPHRDGHLSSRSVLATSNDCASNGENTICGDIVGTVPSLAVCIDLLEGVADSSDCNIWIKEKTSGEDYCCDECSVCDDECDQVGISYNCAKLIPDFLGSCPQCKDLDQISTPSWLEIGTLSAITTSTTTSAATPSSPTLRAPSTIRPTELPTTPPTKIPTTTPTTQHPTPIPTTEHPSPSPSTAQPTLSPSSSPSTGTPTNAPSTSPTTEPPSLSPSTTQPTLSPSSSPSTKPPTNVPSTSPTTETPTIEPSTTQPTLLRTTLSPTTAGTRPTNIPHNNSPTISPTDKRTTGGGSATSWRQQGIIMRLHGITALEEDGLEIFKQEYEFWVKDFYQDRGIETNTTIDIESITTPQASNRRSLEGSNALKLSFLQESEFPAGAPEMPIEDFVKEPFELKEDRKDFHTILRQYNEFVGLHFVSHLEVPELELETPPNNAATPTGGRSKTWAVLSALFGFVGAVLLFGGAYYVYLRRKKQQQDAASDGTDNQKEESETRRGGSDTTGSPAFTTSDEENSQPDIHTLDNGDDENASAASSKWQLSIVDGGDGISTLADPTVHAQPTYDAPSLGGSTYDAASMAEFTFDGSTIATNEPGNSSSYREGNRRFFLPRTLRRAEQSQSNFDLDGAATMETSLGGSIGQTQTYNQGGALQRAAAFREELVVVIAPPGRLGIVVDATGEGPPAVHTVKGSSSLVGQVHVGDRILAVDDVNVISMTSIQVTKIITDKSHEPTRKLSILRAVPF